jgi:hypothetical protein
LLLLLLLQGAWCHDHECSGERCVRVRELLLCTQCAVPAVCGGTLLSSSLRIAGDRSSLVILSRLSQGIDLQEAKLPALFLYLLNIHGMSASRLILYILLLLHLQS